MKTTISSVNKILGLCLLVLFTGFILASCDKDDDNPVNNNPYTISGNANGSQVVPPLADSLNTGTATISGNYNPSTMTLTYTANWDSLSGRPTSGGFYNGASGSAGTSVATWSFDSTAAATGTVSDTLTLTSDQASQLLGGSWYYTFGTNDYPGGEVRGQISATR